MAGPVRAREGAPNALFIVLDDTGFGQLGCYGSPIATPSFDALAADGLRYNNMHTTALCSPSRSCILTGRNHHSNAMAAITESAAKRRRAAQSRDLSFFRGLARPSCELAIRRKSKTPAGCRRYNGRTAKPVALPRPATRASNPSKSEIQMVRLPAFFGELPDVFK